MPIKWNITAKAMKARAIMDQISAEYDGMIADGAEHLGDVKGLRSQVGEMKDDLYSAANVMGNGSGNGGSDSQPAPPMSQNAPAATTLAEPQQNAPAATPSPAAAPLPTGS